MRATEQEVDEACFPCKRLIAWTVLAFGPFASLGYRSSAFLAPTRRCPPSHTSRRILGRKYSWPVTDWVTDWADARGACVRRSTNTLLFALLLRDGTHMHAVTLTVYGD